MEIKKITSEVEIQLTICEYLSYTSMRDNFMFWRQNTIGIYDPIKKKYRGRSKFGMNGLPDIIVIKDGKFIGLEVKSKYGKQTESQKVFESSLKSVGGKYYIVKSLEDVQKLGL